MKHTLSNPYSRDTIGPGEELWKTSIWLSSTDSEFLNSLADRGWLQATVGHLLKKLIHELKRRDLTSYDPDRYTKLIEQCRVAFDPELGPGGVSPGLPEPTGRPGDFAGTIGAGLNGPVEQTPYRDVRPGTSPMAQRADGTNLQPANDESASKSGDGRPQGGKGQKSVKAKRKPAA